mgnify:CR=1 FL=1
MFVGPLVWGWEGVLPQLWHEHACVGGWGVMRAGQHRESSPTFFPWQLI